MNRNKRTTSVELIRLIACFIVVSYHCLSDYVKEVSTLSNNYLSSIFCIGVSIFWMVTGFFIFNNNDYSILIKKTIKKLWIPTIIVSVISFIGYDYFVYLVSSEPMLSIAEYTKQIIIGVLKIRNFAPMCSHLWFVYIYLLVVICYPVLKQYVNYLDKNINAQKRFVLITASMFILNDVFLNEFMQFDEHYFNAIVPASVLIIYGHLIYSHKEEICNIKIKSYICVFLLLFVNFLRAIIITALNDNGISSSSMYGWYSILSIISALCVIIPCLRINKQNDIISRFGKYTLYVYFLHILVLKVFMKTSIPEIILDTLYKTIKLDFLVQLVYVISVASIIFIVSMIASIIVNKAIDYFSARFTGNK